MAVPKRQKDGSWKVRIGIPADIRLAYKAAFNKKQEEIKRWPAGMSHNQVKVEGATFNAEIHARFARMREAQGSEQPELTNQQIAGLAGDWYTSNMKVADGEHLEVPEYYKAAREAWKYATKLPPEEVPEAVDVVQQAYCIDVATDLKRPDIQPDLYEIFKLAASDVLEEHSFPISPQNQDRLTRAIYRLIEAAFKRLERRAEGDFGPDPIEQTFPDPTVIAKAKTNRKATRKATSGLHLLDLLEAKQKHKPVRINTYEDYRAKLGDFIKFTGIEDARLIEKAHVREWRDALLDKPLTAKTVNGKYLAALKSVLSHAVTEFDLPGDVTVGIVAHETRNTGLRNEGHSKEQARVILKASLQEPEAALAVHNERALRWVPWVLAYTGARVTEITQLRGKDVKERDGVHYIEITPEAGSTKGNNTWQVAIHDHLIEMGFLDMVKSVGDGPLFHAPYTSAPKGDRNSRAQSCATKIGKWVREVTGNSDPNYQPNHAWRHTFTTLSREVQMEEKVRDYMMGSGAKGSAREGYGGFTPTVLKREIAKLPRFET